MGVGSINYRVFARIERQNEIEPDEKSSHMKKVLLLLALIVAFFAGCVEEEPSAEELKSMMIESVDKIDTYRFTMGSEQTTSVINHSETDEALKTMTFTTQSDGSGVIDMAIPAMEMTMTTTTEVPDEEPIVQETDMYMINDTMYLKVEGNWTTMPGIPAEAWDKQNMAKAQTELYNSSDFELMGSEKVNGEKAYKLKVIIDADTFTRVMDEQMGSMMPVQFMNFSELFKDSEMEQIIWISKESKLPLKAEIEMKMSLTPEALGIPRELVGDINMEMDIRSTVTYSDYNEPVEIVLPPEAENAPSLFEMMMMSMAGQQQLEQPA